MASTIASFDVTNTGIHVDAEEFNRLADDPNTIIIDMRNHYESEVGHFKGCRTSGCRHIPRRAAGQPKT